MLNVGIIGVSGFAGEALLDTLLKHPKVKITYLSAKMDKRQHINEMFHFCGGKIDLICDHEVDKDKVNEVCELLFLALPHTVSMQFVPAFLKGKKKIIDLSADYRLKDTAVYEQFYKARHCDTGSFKKAVYGLPELYRKKIKKACLIANPGCYPTAAVLALTPLLKNRLIDFKSIIIDAKSGFSGAGRETVAKQKKEIIGNFKAYKINSHQHMPEINQELSKLCGKNIEVCFVPHILPIERGILETIYVKKKQGAGGRRQDLVKLYKKFYKNEQFIRVLDEGKFPQIKDVAETNYCDIGIKEDKKSIIIIAAIDNLLKGASGQAVQNMNIMYGFSEKTALL